MLQQTNKYLFASKANLIHIIFAHKIAMTEKIIAVCFTGHLKVKVHGDEVHDDEVHDDWLLTPVCIGMLMVILPVCRYLFH